MGTEYQDRRKKARELHVLTWRAMPSDTPVKTLVWLYVWSSTNGCYESIPNIAKQLGKPYPKVWEVIKKYEADGGMKYETVKDKFGKEVRALFCRVEDAALEVLPANKAAKTAHVVHTPVPAAALTVAKTSATTITKVDDTAAWVAAQMCTDVVGDTLAGITDKTLVIERVAPEKRPALVKRILLGNQQMMSNIQRLSSRPEEQLDYLYLCTETIALFSRTDENKRIDYPESLVAKDCTDLYVAPPVPAPVAQPTPTPAAYLV